MQKITDNILLLRRLMRDVDVACAAGTGYGKSPEARATVVAALVARETMLAIAGRTPGVEPYVPEIAPPEIVDALAAEASPRKTIKSLLDFEVSSGHPYDDRI